MSAAFKTTSKTTCRSTGSEAEGRRSRGPRGRAGGALSRSSARFTLFTAHAHKATTLQGLARTWRPRKPGRGRWERKGCSRRGDRTALPQNAENGTAASPRNSTTGSKMPTAGYLSKRSESGISRMAVHPRSRWRHGSQEAGAARGRPRDETSALKRKKSRHLPQQRVARAGHQRPKTVRCTRMRSPRASGPRDKVDGGRGGGRAGASVSHSVRGLTATDRCT